MFGQHLTPYYGDWRVSPTKRKGAPGLEALFPVPFMDSFSYANQWVSLSPIPARIKLCRSRVVLFDHLAEEFLHAEALSEAAGLSQGM